MRPRRLVLVFTRPPREEARAKPLGARARAERLHRALRRRALSTAVAGAGAAGAMTRLATTGDEEASWPGVEVVEQRGASFAERLLHAIGDAFADGFAQVLVIGADAPRLQPRHLREAFARLDDGGAAGRAVVGPTGDGGFYLLGLDRFDPSLFAAVPWCTRGACAATLAALTAARFVVSLLPRLDDVDTLDDVRSLAASSDPLGRLARSFLAPRWRPSSRPLSLHPRAFAAFVDARGPPALVAPLS